MLLGLGAAVASCADVETVSDSASLVQRALESASPGEREETGVERQASMQAEMRVRTALRIFFRPLPMPEWVSWGCMTLLTTEIMQVRRKIPVKAKQVMDDILNLNLPATEFKNPAAIGDALGGLSKVLSSNGLNRSSILLARMQLVTPAALVAMPKVGPVQRDIRANFKEEFPLLMKSVKEELTSMARTVGSEFMQTKDHAVDDLKSLAKAWLVKLANAAYWTTVDSASAAGKEEFNNLYDAVVKTYNLQPPKPM